MVMSVQFEGLRVYDFYNFRVRWTEPTQWNDQGDSSKREYELSCWIEYRGQMKAIFSRRVNYNYQGYKENLRFPTDSPSIVQCQVRAWNGAGIAGPWKSSDRIDVTQVPIYFPGLEGYDLRGFDNEEIIAVFRKLSAEDQSSTQQPGSEDSGGNVGHMSVNFKSSGSTVDSGSVPAPAPAPARAPVAAPAPAPAPRPQAAPNFDQARPTSVNVRPPVPFETAPVRAADSPSRGFPPYIRNFNQNPLNVQGFDRNQQFSVNDLTLVRPELDFI